MGKKISRENFANPIVDPLIPHHPLKQPIQLRICTLCDITVQGSFQSAVRSSVCYCRTSLNWAQKDVRKIHKETSSLYPQLTHL